MNAGFSILLIIFFSRNDNKFEQNFKYIDLFKKKFDPIKLRKVVLFTYLKKKNPIFILARSLLHNNIDDKKKNK